MAEQYFYDLASLSTSAFSFGPTNISIVVIDVQTVSGQVALFASPDSNDKLAHAGWVALANDLALTAFDPGLYFYEPIWLGFMRQEVQFPSPGPYASHLAWAFSPGVSANVYVLTF